MIWFFFQRSISNLLAVVTFIYNLRTWRMRHRNQKFESSLSYIASSRQAWYMSRPCLKTTGLTWLLLKFFNKHRIDFNFDSQILLESVVLSVVRSLCSVILFLSCVDSWNDPTVYQTCPQSYSLEIHSTWASSVNSSNYCIRHYRNTVLVFSR